MNNNSHGRLFHHFIPRSMPCILLPSPISSTMLPEQSNDHILNLSASMIRHCPLPIPPSNTIRDKSKSENVDSESSAVDLEKAQKTANLPSPPVSPDCESSKKSVLSSDKCTENVDMNCNNVKINDKDGEDWSSNSSPIINSNLSCSSDNDLSGDEQITEIDVDDSQSMNSTDDEVVNLQRQMSLQTTEEQSQDKKVSRKGKILAFGIDRILSCAGSEKDTKSPTWSPDHSTPVVSHLSSKAVTSSSQESSSKLYKDDKHNQHHSSLSKLHLYAATSSPSSVVSGSNDNPKRTTAFPTYHHSYSPGPYHHHHLSHINSIITSASGGGIHNHNAHQHPLSNCPECLFLRRYCGGGFGRVSSGACSRTNNIPSSSASSANSGAANNMQFSSSMTTPCGPTPSLSASFSWMANPTIYEGSSLISPVAQLAGYNPHMPLPPTSFGLGSGGYSTMASIQQCNSGGTSGRRKRSWSRAVFSNLQRKGLEKRFQIQKYIAKPDRRQLAATLGLTDAQVKVWFQNRRMKWRHTKEGKVSSGTGEGTSSTVPTSSSSPPVSSTTPSKGEGAIKDKKL